MSQFCQQCGFQKSAQAMPPHTSFCRKCGDLVFVSIPPSVVEYQQEASVVRKSYIVPAIAVGLIVLIAMGGLLFFLYGKNAPENVSSSTMSFEEEMKAGIGTTLPREYDVEDDIRDRIVKYYELLSAGNCEGAAKFYAPNVERCYSIYNISPERVAKECESYNNLWKYRKADVDLPSFSIVSQGNGYNVVYGIKYKAKKNENDNWKNFDLTICVQFNQELQITSIFEKKN